MMCHALYVNKIKYFTALVTKCIGKTDISSNIPPHKVS